MLAKHWTIAVVLAVQLAVLVAIPFRTVRTRATGTDITLWTAPVDPFDVMSGYYVTLAYEAEAAPEGGLTFEKGADVWVTVHRADPAWIPVSITLEPPAESPDRVSLRATWNGRRAQIAGADRLYIPETENERATDLLREAKGRGLVDLRVGPGGDVAVLRLRLGGATFGEAR